MASNGLSGSEVFKSAFSLIRRRWLSLSIGAALLIALPNVAYVQMTRGLASQPPLQGFLFLEGAALMLAMIQAIYAAWVGLLAAEDAGITTQKRGAFGHIVYLLSCLLSIFLASAAVSLSILVGFILLLVPGAILSLALCVAIQALAVERLNPIATFKRSFELTRGHRAALFGVAMTVLVPAAIINLSGAEIISGWKPLALATRDPTVTSWWSPLNYFASGLILQAVFASAYVGLAKAKGGTSQQIAEQFA